MRQMLTRLASLVYFVYFTMGARVRYRHEY
jgi:hypothetical protein